MIRLRENKQKNNNNSKGRQLLTFFRQNND